MVSRNIIKVVRDIFGNPLLKNEMMYAPEKVWTSRSRKVRVYGDTNTCQWWWDEQVRIAEGSNNDKRQLTNS